MPVLSVISEYLNEFAPTSLAEDWDNVGLLIGDVAAEVQTCMTCLTITPEVVAEAIDNDVHLIVSHHPLPFKAMKKLTTEKLPSKMVWQLARAGISVYSPHTGFDSAAEGINQGLARKLALADVRPLIPSELDPQLGAARMGSSTDQNLGDLVVRIKREFNIETVKVIGDLAAPIDQVAVACGSAGSFLNDAVRMGASVFVTGESSFHSCLEAKASGVGMILLGHYNSERFALESLAESLARQFPEIKVWASKKESDPVSFV